MFLLTNADPNEGRRERNASCIPKADGPYKATIMMIFSYASDGYQTGITWVDNYRPGGPWSSGSEHIKERDRLCVKAWFEGFDQGIAQARNQQVVPRIGATDSSLIEANTILSKEAMHKLGPRK